MGFSIKYQADDTIEWYKAKVVIKGYIQIDFFNKTYLCGCSWVIHQLDVKQIFSKDLLENIYMQQLPEFENQWQYVFQGMC